jgi:hypothetical protein
VNRKMSVLIGSVALILSILSAANPTAAATARPYTVSDCSTAAGIEICFTDRGVYQEIATPSNSTIYTISGRYSYEIRVNGEVVEVGESAYHFNGLWNGDEPRVFHTQASSSFTDDDQSCSYDLSFVYTNGEVRREAENVVCS